MDERIGRILQRVEDHETDIRQFAAQTMEVSEHRADIRSIKGDLKEIREQLKQELKSMREQAKEDLRDIREQQKINAEACQTGLAAITKRMDDEAKERRGSRWILFGACIGLLGTFISTTAMVLLGVLS